MTSTDVPPTLRDVLDTTYTPTGVVIWWVSRNRLLGMLRPCDVWETDPGAVLQLAKDIEGVAP